MADYSTTMGILQPQVGKSGDILLKFEQKNGGWKFLSSPTILNRILSLKTQNFAVKSNSENHFTFIQKNSEYLDLWNLRLKNQVRNQ